MSTPHHTAKYLRYAKKIRKKPIIYPQTGILPSKWQTYSLVRQKSFFRAFHHKQTIHSVF